MITDLIVWQTATGTKMVGFEGEKRVIEKNLTNIENAAAWRGAMSSQRIGGETQWQIFLPPESCHWALVELPTSANPVLLPELLRKAVQASEEEMILWHDSGRQFEQLTLFSVCVMTKPSFWPILKRFSGDKKCLPDLLLYLPDTDGDGIGSLQTETGEYFLAMEAGHVLFSAPHHEQERIAKARQKLLAAGLSYSGDRFWQSEEYRPERVVSDCTYGYDSGETVWHMSRKHKMVAALFLLAAVITAGLNLQAHHLETEVKERQAAQPIAASTTVSGEQSLSCGALAVYAEKKRPEKMIIADWLAKDGELLLRGSVVDADVLADYCRTVEKSSLVRETRLYSCKQSEKALLFELALCPKEVG